MNVKISVGLALAGGLAAPAAAVTTQTFNQGYSIGSNFQLFIGGNPTSQYQFTGSKLCNPGGCVTAADFNVTSPTSFTGILTDLSGPAPLPDANTPFLNGGLRIGTNNSFTTDRYLPLKFEINNVVHVGNAFFNSGHQLGRVEYAPLGAAVPEPATWVELLAGFAMAGAAVRRRRQSRRPEAAMA